MILENILLLESLFLREYRPRLKTLLKSLLNKDMVTFTQTLGEQIKDLKVKEATEIEYTVTHSKDLARILFLHRKGLKNRLKAFKQADKE